MKDVSAPIYIAGLHWGALRLGYAPLSEKLIANNDQPTQRKSPIEYRPSDSQSQARTELDALLSPW
jgi:hypothetical protein